MISQSDELNAPSIDGASCQELLLCKHNTVVRPNIFPAVLYIWPVTLPTYFSHNIYTPYLQHHFNSNYTYMYNIHVCIIGIKMMLQIHCICNFIAGIGI